MSTTADEPDSSPDAAASAYGVQGEPFNRRSPFFIGLVGGAGALVAFTFYEALVGISPLALAFVDIIPMIGATIAAVVVCAIALATSIPTGIACIVFYIAYQQVENYLIYPRVMSKSVDLPGAVIVIAAMVGAALLGDVGAMLAIPVAAAVLMVLKEVVVRRQDQR
ncbi:MAG: AI-2E family transporter [Nocardioidaceae bacterium]|nr:AI-2E family transporter [Nocardioidaceae bacterium]MCL2614029.1 AI-2E family transporter [Nocardioidaceae bacterium]